MNIYLYIITHPKFSGWIKLGRTNNLANRLNTYNTGCPFKEYKYEYYIEISQQIIYNVEQHFKINIHSNGYEWFEISVENAIKLINKVINENISYTCRESKVLKKKNKNNR